MHPLLRLLARGLFTSFLLSALGCSSGAVRCEDGTEASCPDPGTPPPDLCNSREEALADASCALQPGVAHPAYISFSGDQDWYLAKMPAQVTPRTLVHLSGGYGASNTAVNLSLNLLQEDGQTSLGRKIDKHGQSTPKPIDLIIPFSRADAKLLVLVGDEAAGPTPNFDAKSPYSVTFDVLENPDLNEPNDTTATVIPLTGQAGALVGQQTGYLATDDDVDRFSFTAPAGRKVVYVHLTAPKLSPPAPFRVSYLLLDSAGKQVAEGHQENEFLALDLATARLSQAGTYTLVVQGYRGPTTSGVLPGDLRLQYTLDVKIFDEVDANEPNDTLATAKTVSLAAPGASFTTTSRLGYVPDPDWFAFDLGASSKPSALHFKLTPHSGGGGRFAPVTPLADRQLRVLTPVTQGANAADRKLACQSDPAVCPKGYEGSAQAQLLVESLCAASDPPQCLRAERNENIAFASLHNFEGVLPVAAHAGTVRYSLVVQDDGNNFADDLDYTLTVRWQADPDEETRASLPAQTVTQPLTEAPDFPVPPATTELVGTVGHGYGRVLHHNFNQGQGVRGPEDYDAVPTDKDRYELTFPAVPAPQDRTWTLQWNVDHLPDGGVPSDIALDLEFCDGDVAGGTTSCVPMSKGLTLAYNGAPLAAWYGGASQPLWSQVETPTTTTVTALPAGCFCFEPRFVRGGRFFLTVGAVDRNSYEPTPYRIRTAFTDYPKSYGTATCPAPTANAPGCQFTR